MYEISRIMSGRIRSNMKNLRQRKDYVKEEF